MNFFQPNNIHLYVGIVLSLVNGVMLYFAGNKLLQIIQLSGYRIAGFRAWIKDTKVKYVSRLFSLAFLSFLCVMVTNALLEGYGEYYSYIGLVFYFYFTIVFVVNMFKIPQKTPLKQTKRMSRLSFVTMLLMAGITFGLIVVFSEYINPIRFGIVAITPAFLPVVVPFAHFIMVPIEALVRLHFIIRAKKKLKKYPELIKIGITGSYGKTTTKHILNVMLSKKFQVCMSPHSFNTPMGLTKVVLNYLKPEHEVLIAEMGARQVGDISYLCKLINPKHAIITAVGNQHLATFGSEENVAKAKNELVVAINDGFVVFNGQNQGSKNLYNACEKTKFLCGIDNPDCYVNITNIQTNSKGSSFDLIVEDQKQSCQTKLLGKHNLEDIGLSVAVAHKLGVSLNQICDAICELKPLAHRLEVIEENGLTIIDNAFNSSVESSKSALETLALFEGEKIIITPGLVELGEKEKEANEHFGELMAQVANKVIVVNKSNRESIVKGLISKGFSEDNIILVEDLNEAKDKLKTIVKAGDVILFENDLPDNYT